MTGLLRTRTGEEAKVGTVELFFDLVFVFAITQLSHTLIAHPSLLGAVETLLLFLAVWWVWIFTCWVTNWLDPERWRVRLLLFALMACGLVLSMSIPTAWGAGGLIFAIAYVTMQVGRSLYMVVVMRRHNPAGFRNFVRITLWLSVSALFWIAGGLADGLARLGLWALGLAIEYTGPSARFPVPGLGRSSTADWDVEGGHMAERSGLFIIIALGESILITGATMAEMPWTVPALLAFASAFLSSVAMWWLYFNIGAQRAGHMIAHHDDPGRVARLAYTYAPIPIVAGIIVSAASDEMLLAHPAGHITAAAWATTIGGVALFLLGNIAFKRATWRNMPFSHLVGFGLLAALALLPIHDGYVLGLGAALVLVIVAIWETRSLGGAGDAQTSA